MNILFISSINPIHSLPRPLESQDEMQFGISYISSYLKQHGHSTRLLLMTRKDTYDKIDRYLKYSSPRLICFTAVATEFAFIEKIARYIKKRYPDIYLLIGGVHVSLNPTESILDTFDALCIGEGESPTLQLASHLESSKTPSGIPNLWIRTRDGIQKNALNSFSDKIDDLPFPDRDMWQEWIHNPASRHAVLLGRGCPFDCSYCCNHALKRITGGRYVRFRSVDNIINEIEHISTNFENVNDIYLEVETFGAARKDWSNELSSKIAQFNNRRSKQISFGVNFRITNYSDDLKDLFTAIRRANFTYVNIGLESGSERVRREILKRNYSNEDFIKIVALAKQHGLKVNFYNLIGIPGETKDDFNETVALNRICQPDFNYLSIFFPYPGTDLFEVCKQKGWNGSIEEYADFERTNSALNLPEFPKIDIERGFIWFNYLVRRDILPNNDVLKEVLGNYLAVYRNYPRVFIGLIAFRDILARVIMGHDLKLPLYLMRYIKQLVWNVLSKRIYLAKKP